MCYTFTMVKETNILVIGGGTAGAIAAIQASRTGAETVLIEVNSMLGGAMTVDRVTYPGLFHAHGRQVIGGIGWKLVEEAVRLNNDCLQDFSKPFVKSHTEHHIHINKEIFTLLLEEECLKSGVEIRYYETPVKIEYNQGFWKVDICGKGTRISYVCNQLIDCTGNASAIRLAGFHCFRSKEIQPGSFMFKLCGYNPEKLDFNIIQKEYEEAIKSGMLKREEFFINICSFLKNVHYENRISVFSNHIHGADSSTSASHTRTNIHSRKILLDMIRFLRTLPGLEETTVYSMSPQTAVRETYRIDAIHNITIDEYMSGEDYDDFICYAFYPIDLHDKNGVKPERIAEGIFPKVPLRALIPKGSVNLIAAGRCIGSDRKSNSALRVQATCMATGQAAGAAAAAALMSKTSPGLVPIEHIKKILLDNEAILSL
ncbi:MAG: FAD-dependent oxidoreductase [Clostridia bacterium]|nr:FAD-dependent oxidoreductase [Clostridia bacterium]